MKYIIYEPAYNVDVRHWQITNDARNANFLSITEEYENIIIHPTEDKAALPVINLESVYYKSFPTQAFNFEIFFTAQELAKAVNELPADWYPVNEEF